MDTGRWDALDERLDRLHTEAKAYRDQQTQVNTDMEKRMSRLEFHREDHAARLGAGAGAFAKLEAQIEKVNAKIDWPWWKTAATMSPVVLLFITWVWAAAHYPDDAKFGALQGQVQDLKADVAKQQWTLGSIADNQRTIISAASKTDVAGDRRGERLAR